MVRNNKTDSDWVEKLRKGNLTTFDLIFKEYSSRLYGFAIKYLKKKEETEELVQNVFLKMWENREKLKKDSILKSYLFTIAYNEMCNLFRRKKLEEQFRKEIGYSQKNSFDTENQVNYNSMLERVKYLVEKLPDKQYTAFVKSRKEGKTTKKIAEEMNLSAGTVNNLISSALKFIRQHISENNSGLLLFYTFFIQ